METKAEQPWQQINATVYQLTMEYTMTKPCGECPLLNTPNMRRSFKISRLREFASGSFPCHKSAETVEDDEGVSEFIATDSSVHCAGALIFNEKRDQPNQLMRIMERIGVYDRTKLDMSADVR